VLRGRQFSMKDSYSFDVDWEGLDRSFERHKGAYFRIYKRCGLEPLCVEASSGTMGGSESSEFTAFSDAGEDWVVTCPGCEYAANLEKALSLPSPVQSVDDPAQPEKFATPSIRTIEELADFKDGAPATHQIKTLAYMVDDQLSLFCLRGDYELNDVKLVDSVGSTNVHPAAPEEIRAALGALPGSLGAVGVTDVPVFVDEALRGRSGMTTGANEDDFHLRHVDVERDIPNPRWADLRSVEAGEACVECGKPLELRKAIEIGHIFKLGLRYSETMGARVLTAEGVEVPIVMGSYGIGLDRIISAAIEAHHDSNGIIWPLAIAPYQVVVTPVKVKDTEQMQVAQDLYKELEALGLEVLLDDRDERPGVKFKDADLIGIPFRVVPGPRALAKGNVELFTRASGETEEVAVGSVAEVIAQRV
jgi:prolyl-tRNA synthetase